MSRLKHPKKKGSGKELSSIRLYEAAGWYCTKSGGSLGVADFVALRAGERPQLVQCKASARPWKNFGPGERAELRQVAKRAGAVPILAWWPPYAREHQLLDEWEWPDSGIRAVA